MNWRANVRALSLRQPGLIDAVRVVPGDVSEWVFARDGSLTAFDAAGAWWAGCSVPLLAARAMLKTLDTGGRVACFLAPTLASHLRVALDTLRPDQAVVSVNPEALALTVLLRCGDFSADIAAGRLWFAWGADWPAELSALFQTNPGLATPSQFVRLPTTRPEDVEQLIGGAQKVFAEQNASRSATVAALRDRPHRGPSTKRLLCVLAPSTFRLWEDAPAVLAETLQSAADGTALEIRRFDSDHPLASSPLAFGTAAAACDGVVAADTGRTDLPSVVSHAVPWVTWVTTPRIPAAPTEASADALVVADEACRDAAVRGGWPPERVRVAGWPRSETVERASETGERFLAIVADTRSLEPPEKLSEFSSHLLLWERIRADLGRDPFGVGNDASAYLDRAVAACDMGGERLDRGLFVDALIVPAYQQGLARVLLREGLPVRICGAGWESIAEFESVAQGEVSSRQALRQIAGLAAALVHVWPGGRTHPADALGRPVVRPGVSQRAFLAAARKALAGAHPAPGGGAGGSLAEAITGFFA
jgi:hypothetical protein